MGLDMYLDGEKYFGWTKEGRPKEDGFETKKHIIELGYWRKHPNLHGYIVKKFANGKDDCQPIPLVKENLQDIITAVKDKQLPETQGFFFGQSSGSKEEIDEDVKILEKVITWLETVEPGIYKSIYYRASW